MRGPALSNGYLDDVVGAKAYLAGKAPHISGIVASGNRLTVRLVGACPGLPDSHRSAVLLRGADRHASRPEGDQARCLGGAVLRRVLHARAGSRPEAESQLPRQPPSPTRTNRARGRPLEREGGPGDRGRKGGLCRQRLIRVRRSPGPGFRARGAVRAWERGREEGPAAVLPPRPAGTRLHGPQHASPALPQRAPAPSGQLRHRPPRAGPPGRDCDRRARNARPTNICRPGSRASPTSASTRSRRTSPRRGDSPAGSAATPSSTPATSPHVTRRPRSSRQILPRSASTCRSRPSPSGPCSIDLSRKGEPFDIAPVGWIADYPDPSQFLNVLLSSGILPTLDDPASKRKLAAAARLSGPRRYLAYSRLDADLARTAAPWVAIGSLLSRDFFSARMGCQVFQPTYGFMDLATLCVRPRR